MIKVRRKVHLLRRDHGRLVVADADPPAPAVRAGRIPRASRLMALAIHFDRLIRDGKVADQSELARLAHVTQPRMTQIMNLNHLAPDIQEELLNLPSLVEGRELIHERTLRKLTKVADWREQRRLWAECRQACLENQATNRGRRCWLASLPKSR